MNRMTSLPVTFRTSIKSYWAKTLWVKTKSSLEIGIYHFILVDRVFPTTLTTSRIWEFNFIVNVLYLSTHCFGNIESSQKGNYRADLDMWGGRENFCIIFELWFTVKRTVNVNSTDLKINSSNGDSKSSKYTRRAVLFSFNVLISASWKIIERSANN